VPEEPPVGFDWRPTLHPGIEEDTVAPPLTWESADQGPILGIDLGTSHSIVAVVREGKVEVIPNQEGEYSTPSVLAFTEEGRVLVGSPALHQAALNPGRTVSEIKRRLGRGFPREEADREIDPSEGALVRLDDAFFTPAELSALILGKLLQAAETYLGQPVRRAVLTVPAAFDDAQRQATLDAALLAGLDVQWILKDPRTGRQVLQAMRVITEPTAAALSLGNLWTPRKLAVFHMGGGTCDASFLDVGEGVIQVLAVAGATLGGQDFDRILLDWFSDEFQSRHGIDPRRDPSARCRLQEAAEQAKKDLSQREEVQVRVPYLLSGAHGPLTFDLTVTRNELEHRVAPLLERCRALLLRILGDAGMKPVAIDEVLLIGGMTRMPRLRQLVREVFGREPSGGVFTEEAVARGAAIQGAQLLLGSRSDLLLVDVAPFTLGMESADRAFLPIISRNQTIPCESTRLLTTTRHSQPGVSIRIFQGDDPVASRNRFLVQLDFDGLPAEPAGQPLIEVSFDMNQNGVVWVTASHKASGRKKRIRLAPGRRLNPSEANELRQRAERNATRHGKEAGVIAARARAQACLDRLEGLLRGQANLDSTGVAQLRALADQARQLMGGEDATALHRAVDGLELALEALGAWLKRCWMQSESDGDVFRRIDLEL